MKTNTVINLRKKYDNAYFQSKLDAHVSVFCLSELPTLSTQWAYYGENHAGFCVEYEVDEKFGHPAVKVAYTKERPVIDLIKFQENRDYRLGMLRKFVTTKSEEWGHEKEVRVLQGRRGAYVVPDSAITGVFFGARAKQENIEFIESLIIGNRLNIKCYQCRDTGKNFQLETEPITF